MENATKALLMAGSILIAIIIIGLLTGAFGTINLFQKTQLSEEEEKQLLAYNNQYTQYLGQYVYGTEIITIINKAYQDRSKYEMEIEITYCGDYQYTEKKWDNDIHNYIVKNKTITDGDSLRLNTGNKIDVDFIIDDSLKTRAFKCKKITYDVNGRVNKIYFEEKKWN